MSNKATFVRGGWTLGLQYFTGGIPSINYVVSGGNRRIPATGSIRRAYDVRLMLLIFPEEIRRVMAGCFQSACRGWKFQPLPGEDVL